MIAGKLYRDVRGAERSTVQIDATLREAGRMPSDVQIVNISTSGVLLDTSADVAIGESITIGIAGIGLIAAQVVRREDRRYGCEFRTPLAPGLIAGMDQADTVVTMPFVAEPMPHPETHARFSARTRAALIVMAGISAWGVIAAVTLLVEAIF